MHAEIAHAPPNKRVITSWWFWVVCLLAAYYLFARAPLPMVQSWWQAGQEDRDDSWHRRHRMADWMVLTHSLVGLTRSQVVAKLGEPPPTDYFKDWSMVYILGSERGFMSIDSEWLVLQIDAGGRVKEAKLVRDSCLPNQSYMDSPRKSGQ